MAAVRVQRGYGGAYRWVWRRLESGGRSYIAEFGRNLASVAVKMFTYLTYFMQTFYKCAFNAIFKENAAINYIGVQHKCSILVNFGAKI
jgi:hypothetical protein